MEFEKLKREYAELLKDNTEYAKENIRLTIFYSELMNFLYQNTKSLNQSIPIKYKISENEGFSDFD